MSQQDGTEILSWLKDRGHHTGQIVHDQLIAGTDAQTDSFPVHKSIEIALSQQGIDELYQHQIDAISATRSGQNTVVATPTASGKSLTYTIPAMERAIDHGGKTLYIAPMRALINDQQGTLNGITGSLGFGERVDVGVKIGTTSKEQTRAVKQQQPDIILATLDQLHLSFLPYAHMPSHWRWLFEQLETVVIDEIHTYRGYFGSQAALIFRRLNRLLDHYGNNAQYICCSATIGNPVDHAATVTGRPPETFELIDNDTSESGDRQWIFWNPPVRQDEQEKNTIQEAEANLQETSPSGQESTNLLETSQTGSDDGVPGTSTETDTNGGKRKSHHAESVRLFTDLVEKGYQTLVFTSTRQGAEQYVGWADESLRSRGQNELAGSVHAYHAALGQDRRRNLEAGLKTGDVRGLWSTKALELGIDIGSLDAVILDGYPGTSMSTFQRAGRAGRGDDSCLVILVGSDNPLDQCLLREPDRLFDNGAEQATLNPENKTALPDHVVCAADDHYLSPSDEQYFGETLPEIVDQLTDANRLKRTNESQVRWEATNRDVQYNTSIRNIDQEEVTLYDQNRDETIGKLERDAALRDAHPEAIYTYDKESYRVIELDLDENIAYLESIYSKEYTQSIREKDININDTLATQQFELHSTPITATLASLTVTNQITGYLKYQSQSDEDPTEYDFDTPLPPAEITTRGVFFEIPASVEASVLSRVDSQDEYLSGLHGIEHALISLYPSEVLCDRRDIGGLSTATHPQTTTGTIFVHDGYPGGAGYCRNAFGQLQSLLKQTENLLNSCDCDDGCPSCVHSPQCGNRNRLLSKDTAADILQRL